MIHHATITAMSSDGRTAQCLLQTLGVTTPFLPIYWAPGLFGGLVVGDEVLVFETEGGMQNGVVMGWRPSTSQVPAGTRKLVLSTSGSVPLSTTPPTAISNAAVATVLVR